MTGGRDEGGFTSLVLLSLSLLLALLATVLVALGSVATTRHQAATAADMGALAAAAHALEGAGAACAEAERVVRAQEGALTACRLTGDVVDVVVEVRAPGGLTRFGRAPAHARAGPVDTVPR